VLQSSYSPLREWSNWSTGAKAGLQAVELLQSAPVPLQSQPTLEIVIIRDRTGTYNGWASDDELSLPALFVFVLLDFKRLVLAPDFDHLAKLCLVGRLVAWVETEPFAECVAETVFGADVGAECSSLRHLLRQFRIAACDAVEGFRRRPRLHHPNTITTG
jgi:hypothetical protein